MKVRIHHHPAIVLGAALAIQKAPRILDRGVPRRKSIQRGAVSPGTSDRAFFTSACFLLMATSTPQLPKLE
jgi:hypothetical protein